MALVTTAGAYDRRAIMLEAHRLHRRAAGRVTFADAIRLAWSRARDARAQRLRELMAFERLQWAA